MSIVAVIFIIAIVGFLVWALNTYAASYIAPPFLKLINVVAIVVTLLWLLSLFVDFGSIETIRVGRH